MQLKLILAELHEWFVSLPPDFLFLMLLPLLIGAAGLAVDRPIPPDGTARRSKGAPAPAGPVAPAGGVRA